MLAKYRAGRNLCKNTVCGAFLRCAFIPFRTLPARSALCDMSAFAVLLRLEPHPHPAFLQKSRVIAVFLSFPAICRNKQAV